jgi:DNA-directed RNA polymerase specialized sigma24 family protein
MSTSVEARESHAVASLPAAVLPSWEDFPRRYHGWLCFQVRRTASRLGLASAADPDWALERVQDVYCHLLAGGSRRLRQCRASAPCELRSFLARLAERAVYDWLRQAATIQRGFGISFQRGRRAMVLAESRPDPGADPERRLLLEEAAVLFLEHCRRAVGGRQPDRDALIAWLALIEGLNSREIAHRIGVRLRPRSIDSMVCLIRGRLVAGGMRIDRRRAL